MSEIFCDLDGVLADFDAHADALFGRERRQWAPSRFWRAVADHGQFFLTMPWLVEGLTLWSTFAHKPTILTALPRTDQAKVQQQKVAWCLRELGPFVTVICVPPERDKSEWCSPGAILIDDRERNCARWRAAGGVALHFAKGEAYA